MVMLMTLFLIMLMIMFMIMLMTPFLIMLMFMFMIILSSLVTILFLSRRHTYLSLSVLDSELDCDLQTFPVSSGLHDVLSNLLGGQTKGTNLGGQGGCGSHFSSDYTELDDLDFIGIELGRHTVWLRLNLL